MVNFQRKVLVVEDEPLLRVLISNARVLAARAFTKVAGLPHDK